MQGSFCRPLLPLALGRHATATRWTRRAGSATSPAREPGRAMPMGDRAEM